MMNNRFTKRIITYRERVVPVFLALWKACWTKCHNNAILPVNQYSFLKFEMQCT